MKKFELRLYVAGETPLSMRAIDNLRKICIDHDLENVYDLKVIDVLKEPQLAEDDQIIATPTLVKKLPLPLRKIIGDMSDLNKILVGLDLVEHKEEEPR